MAPPEWSKCARFWEKSTFRGLHLNSVDTRALVSTDRRVPEIRWHERVQLQSRVKDTAPAAAQSGCIRFT